MTGGVPLVASGGHGPDVKVPTACETAAAAFRRLGVQLIEMKGYRAGLAADLAFVVKRTGEEPSPVVALFHHLLNSAGELRAQSENLAEQNALWVRVLETQIVNVAELIRGVRAALAHEDVTPSDDTPEGAS